MEMLCRNPFTDKGRAYGCGQCAPCRYNRRRIWAHRIVLEANQYKDNAFVTLTYSDENLPKDGSLEPAVLQLWLKRVRKSVEPHVLRFFAVGEYGDVSERPHYHVALFNYPTCLHGMSNYSRVKTVCCTVCENVRRTWGEGNVYLGGITPQSAAYLARYVVKKMTVKSDPRLKGRYPEFCRMSLRPGIGASAMHEVADVWLSHNLEKLEDDVPLALRHGAHELPLGRYLRKRLRLLVGKDEKAPQVVLDKIAEELRDVRESAFNASTSFASAIVDSAKGKFARFEAKQKLYKKVRPL